MLSMERPVRPISYISTVWIVRGLYCPINLRELSSADPVRWEITTMLSKDQMVNPAGFEQRSSRLAADRTDGAVELDVIGEPVEGSQR